MFVSQAQTIRQFEGSEPRPKNGRRKISDTFSSVWQVRITLALLKRSGGDFPWHAICAISGTLGLNSVLRTPQAHRSWRNILETSMKNGNETSHVFTCFFFFAAGNIWWNSCALPTLLSLFYHESHAVYVDMVWTTNASFDGILFNYKNRCTSAEAEKNAATLPKASSLQKSQDICSNFGVLGTQWGLKQPYPQPPTRQPPKPTQQTHEILLFTALPSWLKQPCGSHHHFAELVTHVFVVVMYFLWWYWGDVLLR